jgi:hypothetical protein
MKTNKEEYDKIYREENKEKISDYKKEWYDKNKEQVKERVKNWKVNNVDELKDKNKIYREENKDKLKAWREENKERIKEYRKKYRELNRDKINQYEKTKRIEDPLYWLKSRLRSNMSTMLGRKGYTKNAKTVEILGCSFEDFKQYLESKFEPWMNWENRGLYNGGTNYGWDIDHIIPLSTGLTENEIIKLNHYGFLGYLNKSRHFATSKNFYACGQYAMGDFQSSQFC